MEEYKEFLKSIDGAVRKKGEAIRAKRREKEKEKPKVKRTSKEIGVDFSEPAKTCDHPAYAAVPTGDHDKKLSKTETREGDFIEALRGMVKPMTDDMKNLEEKVNTLSLVGPSGSIGHRAVSPFVPRSVKAFQRLRESCNENMGLTEWSDDDDEDKTGSSMKMDIQAFEGKDVKRFSVTFARYLLLTGKNQCKDKVKAALLIEGNKKPDVKSRAENCLKKAKSLEDFFDQLPRLYPEIETDLSLRGELVKIGNLPADPKPAQIENLLNELDKVFEKFSPNALSDQQKLLELASRVNDKTFMKWAEDPNLSPYLYDYHTLSILLREGATFSVSLKHLQGSRGHGGGTATLRRMEEEKSEKGVPKDTDKSVMIEALEALKQELSIKAFPLERTAAKPEDTRGKGEGRGKGKGGRGKRTTLDAEQIIADPRARIQCKHCGKTNHYSDYCFKLQKQQRGDRLLHFLQQNGFEEPENVLDELRGKFGDTGAGKNEPEKGRGKGKGKGKAEEEKKEEPEEEGNDEKRKRVLAAEVENVIELLRAVTREGHTL